LACDCLRKLMGIPNLLRFLKPFIEPVHIKKYAGKRVSRSPFRLSPCSSPYLFIFLDFLALCVVSAGRHRCVLLAPQRRFDSIVLPQCIEYDW
jgi:hypothetical protein